MHNMFATTTNRCLISMTKFYRNINYQLNNLEHEIKIISLKNVALKLVYIRYRCIITMAKRIKYFQLISMDHVTKLINWINDTCIIGLLQSQTNVKLSRIKRIIKTIT